MKPEEKLVRTAAMTNQANHSGVFGLKAVKNK